LEQQLVSCNLKFQLLCKPKTVKKNKKIKDVTLNWL
jgi:hypothetical protein